jgi:hypothetical protein
MAEYLQTKLSVFKDSGKDEKALKFKMMKDVRESQEKQFNALKALWKGSGEGLAKSYWLYVVWMDRDSGKYGWFGGKTSPKNLKVAFMHRCNDIYNQVIKKNYNRALLMQIVETPPIWCSEGDLTEKTCQWMMGTSYRRGGGWWDVKRNFPQVVDQYIPSSDPDYQYVGYAAKGDGNVTKMNLTKNWSYAQNTFNALFKGGAKAEYDVGIIAHSQQQAHWPKYSKLSGSRKYYDSYALIIKYAQDNHDIWKNATISEEYAKVNVTKEYRANPTRSGRSSRDSTPARVRLCSRGIPLSA